MNSDQEIIIEFFEGISSFDNDSVRINNVRFYIGDDGDVDSQRVCVGGALVNACRNKTWFEFCFDEIKSVFDSDGNILWDNHQVK